MRTTIQVILLCLFLLFLACEEDITTTQVQLDLTIETPEADKLNAYPIIGYIKSGGDIAPEIDGRASDYIWQDVYSYEIFTQNGKDGFAPTITMKALYDNWYIYFLVQWEDETKSLDKDTWWFGESNPNNFTTINIFDTTFTYYTPADTVYNEEDTTYYTEDTVSVNRKVRDTVQKEWSIIDEYFMGITETVTYKVDVIIDSNKTPPTTEYIPGSISSSFDTTIISGDEDGFSIFWNDKYANITSCSNLCHQSSMSTEANQLLDIWRWGSLQTNAYNLKDFDIEEFLGYADDKYLTENSFHGDIGDSSFFPNSNEFLPAFMDYHNSGNTGFNPYFLHDSLWVTTITFAEGLDWQGTNTLPGYVRHKPTESRDDVRAKGNYENGVWTLEIKRSINTDDEFDIQFNPDLETDIEFFISVFDNSHGSDHAVSDNVHKLHFLQYNEYK